MDSIRYMVRFLHCGFVAMEPQTGHVKAWVGDIDFHTWKYDKVTAMRQPGSTFKALRLYRSHQSGYHPLRLPQGRVFLDEGDAEWRGSDLGTS